MICYNCGKNKKQKYIIFGILALFIVSSVIIAVVLLGKGKSEKSSNKKEISEEKTETVSDEITPDETMPEEDTVAEEEYIFPNSNSQYLTETEVTNLSAEDLALARNEIFARRGRIFTSEVYKTYFESKSWYEATIEPEVFDANYESLLNDIEKANVTLIKKHEAKYSTASTPDVQELAKKYYGDFLEYYQSYEAEGFVWDRPELLNPIFSDSLYFPDGCNIELYYTLIDLADDGVPELFISDGQIIYGAYSYANDGQVWTMITFEYLGDRTTCYICDNNMLRVEGSGGADYYEIAYYSLGTNMVHPVCVEGICYNEDRYYFGVSYDEEGELLFAASATEEDYKNMENKYPLKTDIKWYKLSEYK